MKARALHLATLTDVSPNVAIAGAALTLVGVGAAVYAGPKVVAMAGLVGGCLFAAATANVVITTGCQLAVDGVRAVKRSMDERKEQRPAGKTIVVPAAAAS